MEHTPLVIHEINPLSHKNTFVSDNKWTLFNCWTADKTFRVAVGKSKWSKYNPYNISPGYKHNWNLREILKNEIVIEFDNCDRDISLEATRLTTDNLRKAQINFEIWDHEGKSPHIHIRNLDILNLDKIKLKEFKKFLIRKFVPEAYQQYVDYSLCGIHLVAIENTYHWKQKYGVKKLIQEVKK